LELAKRDVKTRYRGSMLGVLWAFLSPFLMLAVFTFVFSTIFESRWDVELRSRWDFALLLFTGLIPFWFFSECVSRAPELMFENASYVKRVVFPLEILPWVTALSGLFHAFLSGLVLLLTYGLLIDTPPWTLVLAPVVFLPLLLLVLGISWLLASMGVFFRDLRQIVPVIVMLFMFLSPIFYPAAALPEWFRFYIELNPLATIIEQLRGLLFFERLPDWRGLAITLGLSWGVAWLGLWWFERTRSGFADVV
jgi:lipopolysaccharide transport system permease protein